MGGLLKKILLVDLLQGLWVTFRNQNPKYIYTEQYPTERPRIAERYRGAPRLNINPDTNETGVATLGRRSSGRDGVAADLLRCGMTSSDRSPRSSRWL